MTEKEEIDQWYKYDARLLSSHGVITPEGVMVELSHTDKALYLYLLSRYKYFTQRGAKLHDNQTSISIATNIPIATLKRSMKRITDGGMMRVDHVVTRRGHKSNFYVLIDTSKLLFYGVDKSVEIEDTTHKQKKPVKTKQIIYGDEPF